MSIYDVQYRYRELGRLRLGDVVEGTKGPRPIKLATWRLTSPSEKLLDAAASIWGGEVSEWTGAPTEGTQYELVTKASELSVLVPPQDIDSGQFFELWTGGGCKRRCDGRTEFISGKSCICKAKESEDCKPMTTLLVMLPEIPDIGVWRMRTGGFNAAAEIPQTVKLLRQIAGPDTFAEASLAIEGRTSKTDGETQHFAVPVLRLPFSLATLIAQPGHEMTSGTRGHVPITGKRPELPDDAAFSDEQRPGWGDVPALPEESETAFKDTGVSSAVSDLVTDAAEPEGVAGDTASDSDGAGEPEAYGEGAKGSPASVEDLWARLIELCGTQTKARSALNRCCKTGYTASTAAAATVEQLVKTLEWVRA